MTNNTEKEKIAGLIRNARLSKGYSQQQLADLAQLNLRSVQRIEKAEVLPRAYNLNLLAKQLDLDLDALGFSNDIQKAALLNSTPVGRQAGKTGKLIFSVTTGLLTFLLTAAFLSQSSDFPETSFELFLLLAFVVALYGAMLWRIWK